MREQITTIISAKVLKNYEFIESLCRLCLNQCNNENLNNIFDSNDSSLTLKIMALTGLEITQNDALPKKICFDCRLSLEKSFLFRNKCKNSDGKLRHHFRLTNAGEESNLSEDLGDEFDDEYSESIKVINELVKKTCEKPMQDVVEEEQPLNNDSDKNTPEKQMHAKIHKSPRLRSSYELSENRPAQKMTTHQTRNVNDDKNVLMEVLTDEDEEIEYLLSPSGSNDDTAKTSFDENSSELSLFQIDELKTDNTDSDDMMDNAEYLDDEYLDDTSSIDFILKSLVAQKSGTILDGDAQYQIVKINGEEIEVECKALNQKEPEIEMGMDQTYSQPYEQDESGEFKIFSCTKCPKRFSRRGKFINHEREHNQNTTISGYECPHCQKWFPSNSTLTRHIRVHTGEKPFKCSICKRLFIQKEILKRHFMTHSVDRSFKCEKCPKSFIQKQALRQHNNRYHTENPVSEVHKCQFCPKSFCYSSGLTRHLLIHAGRKFVCDFCQKKFTDQSALKRHTTTFHKFNQN